MDLHIKLTVEGESGQIDPFYNYDYIYSIQYWIVCKPHDENLR